MVRLILIGIVAYLLWYGWQQARHWRTLPPERRRELTWRILCAVVFGLALLLVLTGRAHWITAAAAALLPALRHLLAIGLRALPLWRLWGRHAGGKPRMSPGFRTPALEVRIDLQSGAIDGEVLRGRHAGQRLGALSRPQLNELLAELAPEDRRSRWLLNAYIARRFDGRAAAPPPGVDTPEEDEAWRILGLDKGASREEILLAHKRLMQRLHPDRGGNDYLAAKVNAARDRLLG